ncbi:MAG: hypothetical protein JWO05_1548 [Gemmatimonadetes bacterium]|nr:hypothetical protein [Gemmatimonadota bacterium]
MPKVSESFDPSAYAPVADRITLFYKTFPTGRIITHLVERSADAVIFEARVYRHAGDSRPAATGWATEREGDGEVNLVACLENTETSAIGRALANLGYTASAKRPSREEMEKAARARVARMRPITDDPRQRVANGVLHMLGVIDEAAAVGLRPKRAERWKNALRAGVVQDERLLRRIAKRARDWVLSHSSNA